MNEKNFLIKFEEKCNQILEFDEIRFAGLLNENGTLLIGGYKQGMNSNLTDEQHKSICQELASRVAKRRRFNSQLGHVKYSASRREKVVIMSFPIDESVMMIITNPHINIDKIAFRIIDKLGRQWGRLIIS